MSKKLDEQFERFSRRVAERLAQHRGIRRRLPGGGRLYIERQLPFLCVYRRPSLRPDLGTQQLMVSSASYLIASSDRQQQRGLAMLVSRIAALLSQQFHSFMLVEIWSDAEEIGTPLTPLTDKPTFVIHAARAGSFVSTLETLQRSLKEIRVRKRDATVALSSESRIAPPGLQPLLGPADIRAFEACVIGLEVQPVYRRLGTGEVFPVLLRSLNRGVDRALKKTYFTFSCSHTSHRPEYYFALGRHAMVKAAWEADRQLAGISDAFDLLLQVSPLNAEPAWREFRRQKFQRTPVFHYRPLAIEPATLKRKLFAAPLERIEDATLAQLLHEKQDELDRQITLLSDIGTPRFIHGSLQLYGGVEKPLHDLATAILEKLPHSSGEETSRHTISAQEMAEQAREEIASYRLKHPDFWATVQIRGDMYPGMMVSQGRLLIGEKMRVPASRVAPLLSHEVGVHLVTYFNGLAQPIRQLHTGLPGYDELQEGLAVLSEYLVGGLTAARLRLLAARVLATQKLIERASFSETYSMLVDHEFPAHAAFTVAMRVYRAGGLTKDAVYLRGLAKVLDYLHDGGELEPLFIGKIAPAHVRMIQELQAREVLRPIPLLPHYLDRPDARDRLQRLRAGMNVLDLVESS